MRIGLYAVLTLALVGCNQSDPPSSTDSDNYFPLVDGASFEYLHSRGGWTELVEISAAGNDTEQHRFEQHQSGDPDGESSTSTLELIDGDVLRVAEDQLVDDELVYSVTYDPGFLRFSAAWVDAELNEEQTLTYERTETEAGMDAKDPQPRAHTFTVESVSETVTVPAGTFRNCLRVRRQRALDDPSIDDPTSQEEQDKSYWFAPGVGKVREQNLITNSSEVLLRYEIPGS